MQKAKCILRLPFIVLQDLLVDCFKPTEVRFFLPSFLLQYFLFLNPPHVFGPSCLPVGLRLRAARQDPRDAEALHTSEEMMASHPSPPPQPSPFVFLPHFLSFYFDVSFLPLKTLFPLVIRPVFHLFLSLLPGCSPINQFSVTLNCCLLDFLLKNDQQRRSKVKMHKIQAKTTTTTTTSDSLVLIQALSFLLTPASPSPFVWLHSSSSSSPSSSHHPPSV